MGEIDLVKVCFVDNPGTEGTRAAFLTVIFTWAPLALAGIVAGRSPRVHATMRGAGPLRLLARVAITILAAALLFSPMIANGVVDLLGLGDVPPVDPVVALAALVFAFATIGTLAVFGIVAWHRVLVALASRHGDGRLLV